MTTIPLGRWALAVLGLEASWVFACEAWREQAPWVLLILVIGPWMLLAAAWRRLLPAGIAATLRLVALLALVDVVLDLASPYPPRLAFFSWELVRAGVVLAAAGALAHPAARAVVRGAWAPRAATGLRVTSLVIAAGIPASMLYIGVTGARDGAAPAHAALVLGFALDDAGGARPQLVARVDRAADLYRRGLVPRLILSGGASKAGHTEASVMRDLAMARGVPADAIVLDERARSTIENFACSLPILERLGAVNVLLVTEPWHMTRAMLLARRHGLSVRAAPATSPIWESPRYAAYWLFRDANAFVRELVRQPWAAPGQCAAAECEGCRRF